MIFQHNSSQFFNYMTYVKKIFNTWDYIKTVQSKTHNNTWTTKIVDINVFIHVYTLKYNIKQYQ